MLALRRAPPAPPPRIFYLTITGLFGATALRAFIHYQADPNLISALGLQAVWLGVFIGGTAAVARRPGVFPLYLVLQSALIVALLRLPRAEDFQAALFGILSMQAWQRLSPVAGLGWLGLFAVVMAGPLITIYGPVAGIGFTLLYTFGSGLLASYAWSIRRAQDAQAHNAGLLQQLRVSHQRLEASVHQSRQLAATRARYHLARELHDSVTQSLFSLTLITRSALLLLDSEPSRVGEQVERLTQLAQTALAEMQVLISELRPDQAGGGGLAAALRQHLAGRIGLEGMAVALVVEGDQPLGPAESLGLFRIVQEALNNVAKHARASQARVHLNLSEAPWVEVADQGQGFDVRAEAGAQQFGLAGMQERAAEIGWTLQITSTPGAGTRLRAEKLPRGGPLP